MRRVLIILCLCVGCGPTEFDFLTVTQVQDRYTWACQSEQFVYEQEQSSVKGQPYQIALACMGLSGRCPDIALGEFESGSAQCNDTATNPLAGTCVDDFVAAFDPVGACTIDGLGLSWANGAHFEGSRENGIAYDSKGDVVFIVERGSGAIEYSYARPR